MVIARIFIGAYLPEFNLLLGGSLAGSLLTYYIIKVKHQNQFYILSLICAMIADIILAFGKSPSVGLSYIFYGLFLLLFAFVLKRAYQKPTGKNQIYGIVFLAISIIVFFVYAQNPTADLRFLFYLLPITAVSFMAVNLKTTLDNPVTIGVILLYTSCILLGIGSQKELPFFIPYLLCYAAGQFLICNGLIDSYLRGQEKLAKKGISAR
ncbi:MAG TPA: lysoplasmalogenase family protein [Saprospiraceae bacterium]|nr:lysoplasmalogenase family protein [Saprospiraceae bacterium]HPN70653.1 lysoplasmalogenase family protein [Saprospiraceae bacterium]